MLFVFFFLLKFVGKKNFLSPSHLIYGFGFLFKVNILTYVIGSLLL